MHNMFLINYMKFITYYMKSCKTCGKDFEGSAREYCSWQCEEDHLHSLKKKMNDAIKHDKGHTQKLSRA
jgi:hypothetical protein